jgi:hypothetical protein
MQRIEKSVDVHAPRGSSVWSALESDARRDSESRHPGTWERFKDAIRRGWGAI